METNHARFDACTSSLYENEICINGLCKEIRLPAFKIAHVCACSHARMIISKAVGNDTKIFS